MQALGTESALPQLLRELRFVSAPGFVAMHMEETGPVQKHEGASAAHRPTSYLNEEDLNHFLVLIRDSYQKADMANLFLEQNSKSVNVSALANLRDVLSHLATFLRIGLPPEKRNEQIINATEHLRRAILEPYELTYRDHLRHFEPLFQKYIEVLLPAREQHAFLASAPTRQNIESRLDALHKLAERGRLAKGNNDWVPEWEEGIGCYIDAFQRLKALVEEIEGYWFKFQQTLKENELVEAYKKIESAGLTSKEELNNALANLSRGHRHSIRLHYVAIIIALIVFVLTDYEFHIVSRFFEMLASCWHWVRAFHLQIH